MSIYISFFVISKDEISSFVVILTDLILRWNSCKFLLVEKCTFQMNMKDSFNSLDMATMLFLVKS